MSTESKFEAPYRTASETLVHAMESFGDHEPGAILIIHTDVDGGVTLTGNTSKCMALGLLESVKHMILNNH
jgi:hypothetical protein